MPINLSLRLIPYSARHPQGMHRVGFGRSDLNPMERFVRRFCPTPQRSFIAEAKIADEEKACFLLNETSGKFPSVRKRPIGILSENHPALLKPHYFGDRRPQAHLSLRSPDPIRALGGIANQIEFPG